MDFLRYPNIISKNQVLEKSSSMNFIGINLVTNAQTNANPVQMLKP